MISGYRILCFGDEEFSFNGAVQRMVRALGAKNDLTYVTSLGVRTPRLTRDDARKIGRRLVDGFCNRARREDDVLVCNLFGLPAYGTVLGTRVSGALAYCQLRALGLVRKVPTVVWAALPTVAPIVKLLGYPFFYHAPDWQPTYPGANPRVLRQMELEMVRSARFCATASNLVSDQLFRYNPHTFCIEHSVAFEAYQSPTDLPSELVKLPRPILGFVGGLTSWIDLEAIEQCASAVPHGSVVLIGRAKVNLGRLRRLANVHIFGERPSSAVPSYVRAFDVCLVPRQIIDWQIYGNPLKMLEYLAAGKPVIGSKLPALERFGELVYVYGNYSDIPLLINRALDEPAELAHRRRQLARARTYPIDAEELSCLIERFMPNLPCAAGLAATNRTEP